MFRIFFMFKIEFLNIFQLYVAQGLYGKMILFELNQTT